MKKQYYYSITIGAAMFAVAMLNACSSHHPQKTAAKADTAVAVTVARASGAAGNAISISGQLQSQQTANISTRVMGYITAMHVQVGDHVQKGQLLVSISSQDISAKRAQADAMISAAQAALSSAKKDLNRFTVLYKQQSASQKELDNVTLQYQAAQSQLQSAKEMRNEASASLAYANITAPFAGVVTQKMADAGSMANPGMPLLTIERQGSYQATAYLTESQIGQVKEGMPVTVTIPSVNKTIQAHITQISQSAEATGGQYLMKAIIPDAEKQGLFAGMYVNVNIPLPTAVAHTHGGQIMVPTSAIVQQDELTGLYTIGPDNTAQLRWVRLGQSQGSQVEVLSGLNANEPFITQADGRLYNGEPVKVK